MPRHGLAHAVDRKAYFCFDSLSKKNYELFDFTEMGLTASSDECGDLVRRYGGRRSGDGMGFEALVQTLCQAREGSIDAANGFVRRYVTSLCSNEAVGHAPLLVGSIGVLGIFDWRAWDLRLPVSSSMELCCWDCNGVAEIAMAHR